MLGSLIVGGTMIAGWRYLVHVTKRWKGTGNGSFPEPCEDSVEQDSSI